MKNLGSVAGLLVVLREHGKAGILILGPDQGPSQLDAGDARFLAKILNDAADEIEKKANIR